MLKTFMLVLSWGALAISIVSAQTVIPGGNVSGTWEAVGSPYLIEGEITVSTSDTLFIEPSVDVIFQGHYKLIVNGWIFAEGIEADSILFTAADTSEGWHSIRFLSAQDSSHLFYCIIQHGKAIGGTFDDRGGGIYMEESNPVIRHCAIRYNLADVRGGGIHCRLFSNPTIENCSIDNNANNSQMGGGIHLYQSDPIINNCTITGNIASGDAGGIYCDASDPYILNCIINENVSLYEKAGGIRCHSIANPVIENCEISYNSSPSGSGGIHCSWNSSPTINHCTIVGNSTNGSGGGIAVFYDASPIISNCTITGNSALQNGAGIYCEGSELTVVNTIVEGSVDGGGIYCYDSPSVSITYGDFHNNEGGDFAGDVPAGLGVLTGVNANGDSCDVYSNIFLDPMFVDPIGGDFNLQALSPCIDAGDPGTLSDPDGTVSDIGAFYFDQGYMPSLSLTLTPLDPPIQIPITGGSFDYNILASNLEGWQITGDFWCDVTLPSGTVYGPTLGPVTVSMPVGYTADRDRTQSVPPNAPPGTYTYNGYFGLYPDITWIQDSFTFEKLGAGDGMPIGEWINTGEEFHTMVDIPHDEMPEGTSLNYTYPNPFNLTTTIRFNLSELSLINLVVYDVAGRSVITLVDGWRDAGMHEVVFDAVKLASGIYIYRLETENVTACGKMVLLK